MPKVLLGITVGVVLSLIGYWVFDQFVIHQNEYPINHVNRTYSVQICDSTFVSDSLANEIMGNHLDVYMAIQGLDSSYQDLTNQYGINEEKINSVNTRFNDLYVFGGIIITLLLAINIAIYVKAERDVTKFLDENYGSYLKQVEDYVNKSKTMVGSIETQRDLAEEIVEQMGRPKAKTDENNSQSSAGDGQ